RTREARESAVMRECERPRDAPSANEPIDAELAEGNREDAEACSRGGGFRQAMKSGSADFKRITRKGPDRSVRADGSLRPTIKDSWGRGWRDTMCWCGVLGPESGSPRLRVPPRLRMNHKRYEADRGRSPFSLQFLRGLRVNLLDRP